MPARKEGRGGLQNLARRNSEPVRRVGELKDRQRLSAFVRMARKIDARTEKGKGLRR